MVEGRSLGNEWRSERCFWEDEENVCSAPLLLHFDSSNLILVYVDALTYKSYGSNDELMKLRIMGRNWCVTIHEHHLLAKGTMQYI